jgi:hypothetical protein
LSAATRSAPRGGTCFARKTKSLASSSFFASAFGVISSARASCASCSGVASTRPEKAQIDFTGVEIASGSPARSTMRPRCAGNSISRL